MGVLNSQAKLSDVDNKLTVAAFCRRRLPVIMVMSKMAETVSAVGGPCSTRLPPVCLTRVPSGCKVCRARTCQGGTRYDHRSRISCDTVNLISRSDVGFQPDICRRHKRHMEDFVTWVDTSKLKRTIARYNDEVCELFSGRGCNADLHLFLPSSLMISICCDLAFTSTTIPRRQPFCPPSLVVTTLTRSFRAWAAMALPPYGRLSRVCGTASRRRVGQELVAPALWYSEFVT